MKFCKKCGTPINKTTLNQNWCPNCGVLIENQDFKSEKINDEDMEYAG